MLPTFLTWSLIIKSRHGLLIMDFINNKATINGITEKVELLRKTKLVKEGSLQEKTAYKIIKSLCMISVWTLLSENIFGEEMLTLKSDKSDDEQQKLTIGSIQLT